jgi:hypothetical protein
MALITEKQGITAKRPTGLLPTHPKKGPPLPRLLKVKWPETPPEKVPAKILVKMISGVRRIPIWLRFCTNPRANRFPSGT